MPEQSVGEATAMELLRYLENEIENRSLMVDVEGGGMSEMWELENAVCRTSGPHTGCLEILLSNGPARRGVSLKFEITDDVALPDAPDERDTVRLVHRKDS